jgi:predicted short-subunit dehydrogenase-like oxidoreductase (DUF2520 family)
MADKPIHITLFGGGNVAIHLAKAFLSHRDIELQQIYNRHIDKISNFKDKTDIIDDLSQLKPADIFVLALTDDVIPEFSKKLNSHDVLTVHTSGSIPMKALQTQRKGVFYPFQTFSKEKEHIDLKNIPILIEAENKQDLKLLSRLGQLLSDNVQTVDSQQRKALHVSGVFAANFVNHLYEQARQILNEHQLSFDLLKPLILEVSRKVQEIPPQKAQTGPAIRGDQKTIDSHLKFLKNPVQKKIYKLLTESIQKNKKV